MSNTLAEIPGSDRRGRLQVDALLEQELVTDPKAAARLEAIRQLDDVSYDTGFEPPISDVELDGLDLER